MSAPHLRCSGSPSDNDPDYCLIIPALEQRVPRLRHSSSVVSLPVPPMPQKGARHSTPCFLRACMITSSGVRNQTGRKYRWASTMEA